MKAGIIAAGNEFNYKPIKEKIISLLNRKFNKFRCMITGLMFSKNDPKKIAESVKSLTKMGAEVIVITGEIYNKPNKLSSGICKSEEDTANYVIQAIPESDFLISYAGDIPVVILPNQSIDKMSAAFGRLAAGDRLTEIEAFNSDLGEL